MTSVGLVAKDSGYLLEGRGMIVSAVLLRRVEALTTSLAAELKQQRRGAATPRHRSNAYALLLVKKIFLEIYI